MADNKQQTLAQLPLAGPHGTYLAPSLLAADFANLGQQLKDAEAAGAEIAHIDIMDGHFVPNLSMGPGIVEAIRPVSNMVFDVHLMLSEPGRYVEAFAKAGADHITIHVESEGNITEIIDHIHELGCSAGITLRPGTPVESLFPYLPMVEMALVMTVEPGFGGQSFMASQLPKVTALRSWAEKAGKPLHVEVDGGIKASNAASVVDAGANMLVAGSSVFNKKASVDDSIKAIRGALKF
ncbi:MAG: ribulose-phosphate 3-epimerase [Victivallales bacterium]|nr:ribulose-phosphate 3-epimerase [Victivallales bacterium]